jgi:glucan 1,3-beta-glucosidase
MIRGVNIGSWLVIEKWMSDSLLDWATAIDQYTFDSLPGSDLLLRLHWETYFTEADVRKIASWGLNTLRIPIGYWSYDNEGTPFKTGADFYLERAIHWARRHGLKVLVDCHGSPGSQNGKDSSGRVGNVQWQTGTNLNKSIAVLQQMAKKYGSREYADVVLGLELTNEPDYGGNNNFNVTKRWAEEAYHAVKAAATNPDLLVVMHDAWAGPSEWIDVGAALARTGTSGRADFVVDTHLYENQDPSDLSNQASHIAKACNWTTTHFPARDSVPVLVGEFSSQTNVCANPDGSTVGGHECAVVGCQCSSNVAMELWRRPLIDATRRFVEAQLDVFERSSRGWFIWSYKGPGAWSMERMFELGVVGPKITDRVFPDQCGLGLAR